MLILLDPAHGHNTPGKRSPDGTLLEYAYTRDNANQILASLQTKGHNAQLLVPATEDISLKERIRRDNAICTAQGPSTSSSSPSTSTPPATAPAGTLPPAGPATPPKVTPSPTPSPHASTNPPATPTVSRPHRKLLHGQQTGSRLPPLTRRQTRNNRNHHRHHRKVCAHLGIRLVSVNVYL